MLTNLTMTNKWVWWERKEQYLQEVIIFTGILKFANVVTRLENIMDKL